LEYDAEIILRDYFINYIPKKIIIVIP